MAYQAHGVLFDGTNDYLTRGADLTGAADSKLYSGSMWFKRNGISTSQRLYRTSWDSIEFRSNNTFRIDARPNDNVTIILRLTSSAITDTSSWHHMMFSVDLSNVGKRHLYIDDVDDLNVTTYINDTINFTHSNHGIGARTNGSDKFNGCWADLWIASGQYIDLSIEANRRKFIDSSGEPVDLGADGSTPTGTKPIMFFSGATNNWHTNLGSGGGFTENGALTDCATDPPGPGPSSVVPYPNPRYSLDGGMQPMSGGV